ncbi:UNVERIFIED_CONTAM: Single-stranded DNA-binding protein, mitochondrial [Sesamum latifolium]|uniref:Single-stranded DNA-binding protein, mitochondrial n=1 Tax=Sesamum latifolium TaxID=2727402 RepID=A0AAW2UZJ9_9LAMI
MAAMGLQGSSKVCFSTGSFDSGNDNDNDNARAGGGLDIEDDDFLPERPELQLQGVDPRKGWNFRGVHRVRAWGMFDQRLVGANDLPKPAQWHRIAVHNPMLGAYAVQQLVKNSSVYVEGDIETRVYNDSINGDIKSIPEICVRRDAANFAPWLMSKAVDLISH